MFSDLINSNICIKKSFGLNLTFFQNLTSGLMKIKTFIRSLPMKELSNSDTLFFNKISNIFPVRCTETLAAFSADFFMSRKYIFFGESKKTFSFPYKLKKTCIFYVMY